MNELGIALWGSYLPALRMDRGAIAEIWGRASVGGERSVANNDEDAITMAVEASRNCLKGQPRGAIDGLFFATTTPPYAEKMNSALIATAIDLNRQIRSVDFAHSLRSATGALRAALDSVKSGSLKNVLVVAADSRIGYPRSDQEQLFGDGAAAVCVGHGNVLATFEGSYSICNEMMDVWRNPDEAYVRTWEARFILGEGYTRNMREVVTGILKEYSLEPKDIAKVILPAPDGRSHKALVQRLGFDVKTQAQDPLLSQCGHCGTAHPLLMLVAALEESSPGDRLLLASYADGADAMLFTVTAAIQEPRNQHRLAAYLAEKMTLPSYARFLSYKGLVDPLPGEPFRLFPSATVSWRDRNTILRCHGSRCKDCSTVTYPIQRVCYNCGSTDNFDEVSLSDLEGEVFTFTLDNLAGRSDDPVVVQTVAELGDERVRFYAMMTDCDPSKVKVGMRVALTFRKLYDGAGMHNYFWKLRPVARGRANHG